MTTEEPLIPSARVARGATAVFVKSVAGVPLGLVYIVVLTRLIPPREMGVLAILGFFSSLLSVAGVLGLSSASSKFIPEFLGRGEEFKALGVCKKILFLSILSAAVIFTLLFPLSPYLNLALTHSDEYAVVVMLAVVSIPVTIISSVLLSFLQAFQRMKEYAVVSFIQLNAGRFLGLALLILGLGLAGIYYGLIVAFFLAIMLSTLFLSEHLKVMISHGSSSSFSAIKLLKFSLPLLGVALLGTFLGWVDSVFIWSRLPLSDLGIYQVAVYIYGFLLTLPIAVATALYPQSSELYGMYGKEALSEAFRITSRYIAFIYTPLVFVAVVFSSELIAILAGPVYSEAAFPFTAMALGALAAGFAQVLNLNFMTLGKTKDLLGVQSTSFMAYLFFLLVLVPALGMVGAAVSKAVFSFSLFFIGLWALRKYIQVHFDHEGCWKSLVSSLIASVASLPISWFFPSFILFPLHLLFFFMVYLLCLRSLRAVHDHDLMRVEAFLPVRLRFMVSYLRKLVS